MATVRFRIEVKGVVGGSFDIPDDEYERLLAKWEGARRDSEQTEAAEELLGMAPFDYFRHLCVDDMEITDLHRIGNQ